MSVNPDVKEIVKLWLEANGYDGLYDDEEPCGCKLDDLMPCGEPECFTTCRAGYYHDHVYCPDDGDYSWGIGPQKPEKGDANGSDKTSSI